MVFSIGTYPNTKRPSIINQNALIYTPKANITAPIRTIAMYITVPSLTPKYLKN